MDYVCVCCVLYVGRLSLEKGDGGPHFVALKMVFSLFFTYTYTLKNTIECLSGGLLVYLGHTLFIYIFSLRPRVFI